MREIPELPRISRSFRDGDGIEDRKLTILPREFLSPLDFRGCAGIVGVAMLLVFSVCCLRRRGRVEQAIGDVDW